MKFRGTDFVREFTWLAAGNQLAALAALAAMLVLARSEPLHVVGSVVFAQSVGAMVMLVLDVRFEDAIQRYFPLVVLDAGRQQAYAFFWRLCRLDSMLGVLIVLGGISLFASGLLPDQGIWDSSLLLLALIGLGVSTVGGSLNAGYAVTGRLPHLARLLMATSISTASLSIVGVLIGGAPGYLLGFVVGSVLQILVLGYRLLPHLPISSVERVPRPRGLVGFLFKSSSASSLAVGSDAGVLTLVGLLGSSELVALLKVAQAPGRIVLSLFSPLSVQAFPRLAEMASRSDWRGVWRLTVWISRRTALVGIVGSSSALLVVPVALPALYGRDFQPAVWAAVILVLAASVRAVVVWSKVLPLALGKPGLRLLLLIAESIILLGGATWACTFRSESQGLVAFAIVGLLASVAISTFWILYVHLRVHREGVSVETVP